MTDLRDPAPRYPRPLWRGLAGLGPTRLVQIIGAMGLAATALFGGLDQVNPDVTNIGVGERYDDGALTVTLKRATLVPAVMAGDRVLMKSEPGVQYLAVVCSVTNDGTRPVRLSGELDLRGIPGSRSVGVFRIADGTRPGYLGPGLSDELGFVWQVPVAALHAGQTVKLRIWKKSYAELSVGEGHGWLDSQTEYGQAELTVGAHS